MQLDKWVANDFLSEAGRKDTSRARSLIKQCPDLPNYYFEDMQKSVLLLCLQQFKEESAIILLLDYGASFATDFEKQIALSAAVWHYQPETLKRLIEIGALIDGDCEGSWKTPLMVACEARRLENVEFLLNNGASVNAQNQMGKTALHYLYEHEPHGEWDKIDAIAKLLIENGANEELVATYQGKQCKPADLVRCWLAFMLNRTNTYCQSTGYLFSEHNHF